jgi:hypothetical protein
MAGKWQQGMQEDQAEATLPAQARDLPSELSRKTAAEMYV